LEKQQVHQQWEMQTVFGWKSWPSMTIPVHLSLAAIEAEAFDAFFGLALQLLLPSLPLESLKMILLKLEQTSGQRKGWRFFCRGGEIAIINVQEKGQQTEL